jgi:hypothetical protein
MACTREPRGEVIQCYSTCNEKLYPSQNQSKYPSNIPGKHDTKNYRKQLYWALHTHSTTPTIRINWDCELSGYAENLDNWIFFENRLHFQFKVEKNSCKWLFLDYTFIRHK